MSTKPYKKLRPISLPIVFNPLARLKIYGQNTLEGTRKSIFSSIAVFSSVFVIINIVFELILVQFFDPSLAIDYDIFYIVVPGLIVFLERKFKSKLIVQLNIILYISGLNYMGIQNIANFTELSFPITMLIWGLAMLMSGFLFRPVFVFVESAIIVASFVLMNMYFPGQTYFTSYTMFVIILLYAFFIYTMSLMMEKIVSRSGRQTEQIRELFEKGKETFSEVAHRLKTPLTVLKFELEELEDSTEKLNLKETIEEIQNAVESITKLAKANVVSVKQEVTPIRIEDLISPIKSSTPKLVQALEKNTGYKRVIKFDIPPKVLNSKITINETQIRECLLNLLDNSIKHSGKKNVKIMVRIRKNRRYFVFEVSDNGAGFDTTKNKKNKDKSNADGLHIGLDICRKIVNNHNGIFEISSSKGKGTKATMHLPVDIAE